VTDGTVLFLDRILAMGFLETSFTAVMTGKAEFRGLAGEEIFFRRGMDAMATQAAIVLDNPVYDLAIEFFFLMTGKADRIPLCRQKIWGVGGMRIVAGNTFSPPHGGMDIFLIQFQVLDLVTGIAEVIAFFLQNEFRHHAMPKMALFAFFVRNHLVNILHGKELVVKFRMAVQTAFLGEFPSRGLGILT
jgi:hypothetical protein